jgi:hypothetical protein
MQCRGFWQPSSEELRDGEIFKLIDMLMLLPINGDDINGKDEAVKKFKEQIEIEKKKVRKSEIETQGGDIDLEFDMSYARYIYSLNFPEIYKSIINSKNTELLKDRSKIKNEILNIIDKIMYSILKSIKWKKPREFKTMMKEEGFKGYIYIIDPPVEYHHFVMKSKKQLENEIKKYKDKMIEIFYDIDKLCSDRNIDSQKRIASEIHIRTTVKILLRIYINGLLDDDEGRCGRLKFFNFDPIF